VPGTSVTIGLPLEKLDVSAKYKILTQVMLADLISEGQRGQEARSGAGNSR
jgi:hypothetical protein